MRLTTDAGFCGMLMHGFTTTSSTTSKVEKEEEKREEGKSILKERKKDAFPA
jgi:hypothetical protein